MKTKLLGFIASMALLGASQAGATTLVGSTSNATGLDGLIVDGVTYDIRFQAGSYDTVFGLNPPQITNITTVVDITNAVVAALNSFGVTSLNGTIPQNDQPSGDLIEAFLPYAWNSVPSATPCNRSVCSAAAILFTNGTRAGPWFSNGPTEFSDEGTNYTFLNYMSVSVAAPARAYITNSGDGTVSVIDTTNNTVVMTIPVGRKPFGVAVTPDGSKVYIANSGDGTVSVINTATNTVIGSPIAVGTNPVGVAVTPDGKTVYVTNQGDGTVSVINTATDTVIGSAIDVGCPIANCGRKTTNIPTGIAVTPDGSKVYVGNIGAPGYASVIATASNTVTTINTKKATSGVAVTPNGSEVYLGSLNGVVLAIDVATNSLGHGSTIGVGSGSEGVAVTPDGSKVYVANSAVGTVSVINTGTNKVIGSIAVGSDPQGVSVTSDGSKVYVANEGNGTAAGTVSIIDTATNTAESSTITVGKAPLAFGIFIPPPKPK
jgi:YVTN family beta-propeller protein